MANAWELTGTDRVKHLDRIVGKLNSVAAAAGVDVREILKVLGNSVGNSEYALNMYSCFVSIRSMVWASEVTITVKFTEDKKSKLGFIVTCELSWGSTGRSISESVLVLSRYRKALEFAAFLEGLIS